MTSGESGGRGRDGGKVILNLVTGACLLFSVGLVVNNIYPTRRRLEAMREEKSRLEQEIRERRDEIDRLKLKGDALESDPYTQDRTIRDVLRVNRPGEKLIRIEGE